MEPRGELARKNLDSPCVGGLQGGSDRDCDS
jgi:hypothetical protein